jgi:biopolymer transport protein ExbD
MAFNDASAASKCDINVVPLIDVLLVLLIIFMVTAPIVARELVVDLPQVDPDRVARPEPRPIRLRIDASGSLFWGNDAMPRHALATMLRVEASRDPQPALQLETDADARYALFADVLAAAHTAGMQKIGFVSGH